MSIKQAGVKALRTSHLLPLAERARYVKHRLTMRTPNRRFAARNPAAAMPPSWLLYDASSSIDHTWYWRSGRLMAQHLREVAHEYLGRDKVICEWGCGPGRVVRHLADDGSGIFSTVIGTDYNRRSIKWCRERISGATFHVNELEPPLPLDDASVDLLCNFSVLTHLSEASSDAWMAEMARVVRPGGIVLATVHGDHFRDLLVGAEKERYATGTFVERGSVLEGSRTYVAFHPPGYMGERITRAGFEVIKHEPYPPFELTAGQDIWLLRRP